MTETEVHAASAGSLDRAMAVVAASGRAAWSGSTSLAQAPDDVIDGALAAMAERLVSAKPAITAANEQDLAAAERSGMSGALRDRLRLDEARIDAMAAQLRLLAETPAPEGRVELGEPAPGLRLIERRRPVGVIGANFEARPNVTIDVASQLVKSRNGGVLRTGSAALTSALALQTHVIRPALSDVGLDPDAIQLIGEPGREYAIALMRHPGLIPMVIIRGSGETTRALSDEAARHGVRTLAHADGGGVLYVDAAADREMAARLLAEGLDRLGVCNRVNLVLVHRAVFGDVVPRLTGVLDGLGIRASLPPHDHPLGHEWALDDGSEATVTVAAAEDAADAAAIANRETSGLGATIVTGSADAARRFMDGYRGTGVFWNATTRLLDGFKLHRIPETGINVDHVPGPRGPVTFRDLYLRQYAVVPAGT